jgi:hypothetical protein
MKYLNGDTFFNRWPVPVTPVAVLPRESEVMAEKIFDLGEPVQVEEADNGEETLEPTSMEVPEGQVIPFPHEHHSLLTQEMLHVFHADVLVDTTPGSGSRLLAALNSNIRAALKSLAMRRLERCSLNSLSSGSGSAHLAEAPWLFVAIRASSPSSRKT